MTVDQLKAQGNKAFSSGNYEDAIKLFSQAIELDPTNHVLYSNRSAAYASLKDFDSALQDAEKTIECKSDWPKGYSRKGAALFGKKDLTAATKAYEEGLKLDPENALLKQGLSDVENAFMASMENPFQKVFSGDVWGKIASNPKLSPYLSQPDYAEKIKALVANPSLASQYMQDHRIMMTILTLMGIQAGSPDEVFGKDDTQETPAPQPKSSSPKQKPATSVPKTQSQPEPMEEDVPKTEEELLREKVMKEKELGNEAYKKKDFDTAIQHYDKAWELSEEKEVSILTNKAAVMFEKADYDTCVELCLKAVDLGRELRADYKLIARALGRIGNAYLKKDDLPEAIKYFQKSLTEHRTANILNALRDAEKLMKQREKEAYTDPKLSDEARERGNQFFKDQKYAEAVKEYEEAIKRNDQDPKGFSNRAAAYTKLGAIPEALRDCETAIALDPTFVKAYIRKAACEFIKREYSKCLETCEQAKGADPQGKHRAEIDQQIQKCMFALNSQFGSREGREAAAKKAMEDPEIQGILTDPVMQQILQQMQSDPGAVRDHMKNPAIASKIRKLMASGILETR